MSTLTLQEIARGLGGRVIGNSVRCPGPGHSRHDDSLAVTPADNEDGFLVHSFCGDDFKDCKDYVRDRLGLEQFAGHRRASDPITDADREVARSRAEWSARMWSEIKLKQAASVWNAALPLSGSLAEYYLQRRLAGLPIPGSVYAAGALRYASIASLPPYFQEDGRGAAAGMIALMTDAETGIPTGIHVTFITADGGNLKEHRGKGSVRRMRGHQGVVRLWPDAEVEQSLAIGEGVETCLAGFILRDGPPVWSAINAGGLAKLPVLSAINHLRIYADNDKSQTGQRKAEQCAERWAAAGRSVVAEMPSGIDQDFNDLLLTLKNENLAA